MGRLRHLELENFKSYEGKQIVGPFDDFTCVIGPNGAGKSNMMDAVSFVLGVQSRNLRATHLKELIFRKDVDAAPARKASVKLVYEVSENEVDGKGSGTQINFMRTITSSGVSTYRLDNKDVTFEVYENMLQEIGVLVKARNFLVFQGDVESVASKSPVELTKLIEQISGSDIYRTEYDDLSLKKEEAEETTLFSLHKKKMYATQKKEVKDQKDEAELYQAKQAQVHDLKSEHVLLQIWRSKEGMEEHQEAADNYKSELSTIKERENELEAEILEGKKELARVSKLLATSETDAAKRSKQVLELTPKLEETRARLKSLRKRLAELEKGITSVQKDRDQQVTDNSEMRAHIAQLEKVEADIQAQLDADAGGALKLDSKKVEEYTKLREEVAALTATDRAAELTLNQDISGKKLHIQRLEVQESSLQTEIQAGDKLISEYADRSDKLKSAIAEGHKDAESITRERDLKNNEMRLAADKTNTLTIELESVNSKLKEAGEDRRRNKHEHKIVEAIETMQRIFTGVHGRLIDLCHPIQKKYAQAIAVAAGKQMDAIVVESKQVASECIRYLKDQRIGTCIFLPLDNMVPKPVPDRLRTFAPKYRLCIDLMECEDKIKPALAYALGSTLVCDSLEDAQELCFARGEKSKVVTTRGQVISKSGAMTGGAPAGGGSDRWEEKEVERLKRRRGEIDHELVLLRKTSPTRQDLVDLETRLKTLLTRLQFSEADLKISNEKLAQVHQQKVLKNKTIQSLRSEIQSLSQALVSVEKRLAASQQKTRDVENNIFRAFSASVGVTNIREYEEKQLKRHQENVKKRSAISEQRASLQAQLDYSLKRDFTGVLNRLQAQEMEAQKEAKTLEKLESDYLKKEEEARTALKSFTERVASAKEERDKASKAVKALQIVRGNVHSERDTVARKLSTEEIMIERARAQLHEILQKAQLEEISLPTLQLDSDSDLGHDEVLKWAGGSQAKSGRRRVEDSEESNSSGNGNGSKSSKSDSAHFSQSDNSKVIADAKKVSKVDLSSMKRWKSQTKAQIAEFEAGLTKRISALVAELETIQPNMHAVERYDGMTEKLKACEGELQEQQDRTKDISQRFDEVKRTRQRLFQECFSHISDVLGVIYKDLTKSTKHPAGGNAYLTLDNTDEPYLQGTRFTAMPPMKRFRDMDQLSGGEKTMAALALLFSVHSYRQAPFFVLDEVDAALDNVNVKKVSYQR